jgi:competence protein ComEA
MKKATKKKFLYLSAAVCCVIMFMTWYFIGKNNAPAVSTYSAFSGQGAYQATESPKPRSKAYISGEVAFPGVYDIGDDFRITDLIELAGGATEFADLTRVNLSARVKDEQHVNIPRISEKADGEAGDDASGGKLVHINIATKEELETLPGIGEKTAQAIIAYRDKNGRFDSAEDLLNITNIGEKTLEKIMDLIIID